MDATGGKDHGEKAKEDQIVGPDVDKDYDSGNGDKTESKNLPIEHAGYEEVCFAENDRDLHKNNKECHKNPGHKKFIPVNEFVINHLPEMYRESLFYKLVKTLIALTVCLRVRFISKDRPETYEDRTSPFPFYLLRGTRGKITSGTGCISEVDIHEVGCRCEECQERRHAEKPWAAITVKTAGHVVYDESEAEKTTCYLFYDEKDRNKARQLHGFKSVHGHGRFTDCNYMRCQTHDIELACQLKESLDGFEAFAEEIRKKSGKGKIDSKEDLVIIVSHPHGQNKQLSIGNWFYSEPLWQFEEIKAFGRISEGTFIYNAATCPGSSGARVWILGGNDNSQDWCHSSGTKDRTVNRGSLTRRVIPFLELWREAQSHGLKYRTFTGIFDLLVVFRYKPVIGAGSLEEWLELIMSWGEDLMSDARVLEQALPQVIEPHHREGCEKFALALRDRLVQGYGSLLPSLEQLINVRDSGVITDLAGRVHLVLFLYFDSDLDGKLDHDRLRALLWFLRSQQILKEGEQTDVDFTAKLATLFSNSGHISLAEYTDTMLKYETGPWQRFCQANNGGQEGGLGVLLEALRFRFQYLCCGFQYQLSQNFPLNTLVWYKSLREKDI